MSYIGSTPTSQLFAPGTDTFSGTGSQTAFTLSRNVGTVNDILVVINNVDQQPSTYSVSGSTLTLSPAPSAGTDNIYVRYLSNNLQSVIPQQGSVSSSSMVGGGIEFGMRNRLINGDMRIDQRNAGASVTPTANTYTLDRWRASVTQSSKFSVQQDAGAVTPPVGFSDYLGCTSLSAYSVLTSDAFDVRQFIEGYNVADLSWGTANAKTVTLSFLVRSSLTGTFGGSLRNSAANRSYPFSYTISAANTWEQKSITIAGDTTGTWLTTDGTGINVTFSIGSGATFSGTAGAWAAGNFTSATGATSVVGTSGATFYITGVQLEKGSAATPFDYRPYGAELALCQRYYQTFTVTSDWGNSSSYAMAAGTYLTEMRAAPTATYTPSAGSILNTSFSSRTYQFQLQSVSSGSASNATATFSIEL